MIEVPDPVPLDLPPGDAGGLEDVVEDVAGAGYWLAVLATELSGPAAAAPGWLGDDAAAAAAQVCTVAAIAAECSVAVGTAAHRLRRHHDLLVDVRHRVRALREEQQDDFAGTWQRLSRLGDPHLAVMVDAPERVAAVEELRAGEASRRRRHAALLEELADDAAATARVLAESSGLVGGRGARGDGDRVLAHLAAELPGWGERDLTARGARLAHRLLHESLTSPVMDDLVRGGVLLAGSPAFANALLASLGEEGVALLLGSLGSAWLGGASPVAQLLAAALGAAVPGDGRGRVDAVLDATYVRADDRYGSAAQVAAGMALVLAAGAGLPGGGVRPATVAGWARQMLQREHELDLITGIGEVPADWPAGTSDPVALAITVLARRGDPGSAGALLAERDVWRALLSRMWADGGTSLAEVVAQAGRESSPAGARAVRSGLEVVGSGLTATDTVHWTVDRATVAAVSPALAAAAAGHPEVVTGALATAAGGEPGGAAGDRLRGLGLLTVDADAARTIGAALEAWVVAQPIPADTAGFALPAAVAVPGAFVAVREYGQRLDHALHGFEMKAEAERRKTGWDATVGVFTWVPSRLPVGLAVGVAEGYAAMAVGSDGSWDNGPDDGLRFDRDRAAEAVLGLVPAGPGARHAMAEQARQAFDRATEALGRPLPPTPPTIHPLQPLIDTAVGTGRDELVQRGWKRLRGLVG